MAFSDFKKISEVQKKFRIKYTADDFFTVEAAIPSGMLSLKHWDLSEGCLGGSDVENKKRRCFSWQKRLKR